MGEGRRADQGYSTRTKTGKLSRSFCATLVLIYRAQTYESIQAATLDVEPRRIILEIPPLYTLDMDVSLPDAHLVSIFGGSSSEGSALMLKRQRDFDVEGAKAEWRVADGVVIIDV